MAVDHDGLVLGQLPYETQYPGERFARLVAGQDGVRDRYRAGVDERVPWNATLVLELDDGIESGAGRLAPDLIPEMIADLAQSQGER